MQTVLRPPHAGSIAVLLIWGVLTCGSSYVVAQEGLREGSIVKYDRTPLRTGAYSVFAAFQRDLAKRIVHCGREKMALALIKESKDGLFGQATARAMNVMRGCGIAVEAFLTDETWRAISSAPLPSFQDKTEAIILTFEATDFGQRPEWNICQDGYSEDQSAPLCDQHSDPCSFLTWGPRGATAGQGREIQWILENVMRSDPQLLEHAFADELRNVQRFIRLRPPPVESCDGSSPLEHFMCAVWLDPERRRAWERGLQQLSREGGVRDVFNKVYATDAFDGFKMRAYYALWHAVGLVPTEIDYAFFLDRATQIGEPPREIADALAVCIEGEKAATSRNAAARRCLSRIHPHPTQPQDRRARDVAFYKDAYPAGSLTRIEYRSWAQHIPVTAAANFGLSDARSVTLDRVLKPDAEIVAPQFSSEELTDAERQCPSFILKAGDVVHNAPR